MARRVDVFSRFLVIALSLLITMQMAMHLSVNPDPVQFLVVIPLGLVAGLAAAGLVKRPRPTTYERIEMVLYLNDVNGSNYRFKVFPKNIWVERQQPRGDNTAFDRSDFPTVYQDRKWSLAALLELVSKYEAVNK